MNLQCVVFDFDCTISCIHQWTNQSKSEKEILGKDRIPMLKKLFINLKKLNVKCYISTNNHCITVIKHLMFILGNDIDKYFDAIHSRDGFYSFNKLSKLSRGKLSNKRTSKESFVLKYLIEKNKYKKVIFIDDEPIFNCYKYPENTYDDYFKFDYNGSDCFVITTLEPNGLGMTTKEIDLIYSALEM